MHVTKRATASSKDADGHRRLYVLLILIAIILASAYISMLSPYGPSYDGWDSYYYSLYAHNIDSFGYHSLYLTAFTTKYLMMLWMSLFYKVFGANLFADGLSGMPILAFTAILVYLIGTSISGRKAGLLSALFFCFMPIIVVLSSSGGDDIFVAMFTALAMAALIYGIKNNSVTLYALAGFLGVVGATGSSVEELMIFVVMLPILLFYVLRRMSRKQYGLTLFFAAGMALGVLAIMAMGSVLMGNPLAYFDARFMGLGYLSSISNTVSPAGYFMIYIFHYPFNLYDIGGSSSFPQSIVVNPFISDYSVPAGYNYFGYFGIAALISSVYLLFKRDRRSFVILFWFYALLLYLFFGTVSYHAYEFIIPLKRFMIILAPPMALTVGIAADGAYNALGPKVHRGKRNERISAYKSAGIVMLSIAIAFILINSLIDIPYIKNNDYVVSQYFRELGAEISSLPASDNVYLMTGLYNRNATGAYAIQLGSVSDLNSLYRIETDFYSGYSRDINYTTFKAPACDNITNSSYFIIVNSDQIDVQNDMLINTTKFINECGLIEVFNRQYPNNAIVNGLEGVGLYRYIRR